MTKSDYFQECCSCRFDRNELVFLLKREAGKKAKVCGFRFLADFIIILSM